MDKAAERGLILAALGSPAIAQEALEQGIGVDSFADTLHRKIWLVVSQVVLSGRQIDEFVLASALGKDWDRAEELWDRSQSVTVDWKALIPSLRDHEALRAIDKVWAEYQVWKRKNPREVRQFLPTLIHMLSSVAEETATHDPRPSKIRERMKYSGKPISTGLKTLDEALHGGYRPGELYVFGAPSGHGKTAMAGSLAAYAVAGAIPTVFFSLELDDRAILTRIRCAFAAVTWEEVSPGPPLSAEAAERLAEADKVIDEWLRIYDFRTRSPEQIDTRIALHVNEFGAVGLVLVDHIGLVRGEDLAKSKLTQASYIGEMTYSLRNSALRHDTTIVTFSQLSEEQSALFKKKRNLSHVTYKGSGDIFNAADYGFIFMRDPDEVNMGFFRKKKDRMKGEMSRFEIPHMPQYYLFCNGG